MHCPSLSELPLSPLGKTGWPWTKESSQLPALMPDGSEWPRISIVTPSYNQGQFIEETIRSVLLQGYPNIEYVIIDGGSTDNTLEIINKYQQYITYWISEPDKGQSHALNKGFRKATGQLIGWQNSDDFYHSDTFVKAAEASLASPNIDIIYGNTNNIDTSGEFIRKYPVSSFDIHEMIPYLNMCNQSLFFKDTIFTEGNFIDENFCHAMDLEFLVRLALENYKFYFDPGILGYYRVHKNSKGSTQNNIALKDSLIIYRYVFQYPHVQTSLKAKAVSSIHGLCLESFRQRELHIFRESLKELISLSGLKYIDIKIIFKYLISFLGVKNTDTIMRFKGLLK
jgi:glycosyltransferase involved in cell wall biosynthesis